MRARNSGRATWRIALLLLLIALVSRSFGYVYLGAFWPDGTVTLQLQLHAGGPSLSGGLQDGASAWNQVAQQSVDSWNAHIATTKFAAVNNASTSKAVGNGQNDVYWASTIEGYTLDEHTLGVTLIDSGESEVVRETDVVINKNARGGWNSYRGPHRVNGANDLRRVMLHELGHVLGLDHPDEHGQTVSALMHSSISDIDALTSDDVRGATYVYGPRLPPVIRRQPADLTVERSSPFELSAEISGRGPLSYQWLRNGKRFVQGNQTGGFPQQGDPTIRYGESFSDSNHVGEYRVVVSNPFGSVVSNPAFLKLTRGITRIPGDQNVIEGETATFSVEVIANEPVTYEWRRTVSGHYLELIPGATGPMLTLSSVSFADVGTYSVHVRSGETDLGGATARLDVKLGFEQPPLSQGVRAGDRVTLDAAVIGAPGLSYPRGIVANPDGSFFVGGSSIRKISADGELSSLMKVFGGQILARRSDGVLFFAPIGGRTIDRMVNGVAVPFAGNPNWGPNVGFADQVSFSEIVGLAFDNEGTLYVADRPSATLKAISPDGVVRHVAGSGVGRSSWEPPDLPVDGTGTSARFGYMQALAVDGGGNIYVVDEGIDFAVIRKVTAQGVVTTLAGNASVRQQIVDGTGAGVAFWKPRAITSDAAGNIYVIDRGTIRKIAPDGVVATMAGAANEFGHVDGMGSVARFSSEASGLAVGKDGALYVEDSSNHTVRRVTSEGVVTTFAGRPGTKGEFDGTPLNYQWLHNGTPITGATEPTLALEDVQSSKIGDYQLRVSNSVGTVTSPIARVDWLPVIVRQPENVAAMPGAKVTLAVEAESPSGRPLTYQWKRWDQSIPGATGATFVIPTFGPELVSAYWVVVSDGQFSVESERVFVDVAVSIQTQPKSANFGDGGSLILTVEARSSEEPLFASPEGVTGDAEGNIYVADSGNYVIRKISPDGRVTTLAGKPGESGSADGIGADARFGYIRGITIDAAGSLYVSDDGTIRRVTIAGAVTTLAGKAGAIGSKDGVGEEARFIGAAGLAVSAAGDVYVAELGNYTVRKITPSGVVTTLCGVAGQSGKADGRGSAARFIYPSAVAIDAAGDLIVVDGGHLLRRVTLEGEVSAFAGNTDASYFGDGPREQVGFQGLRAIAIDSEGNVLLIDQGLVRRIGADGYVSTIAGQSLDVLQDLNTSNGLWPSPNGNIIVAQRSNNLIRSVSRGGVSTLAGRRDYWGHRDGKLTRYEWFYNDVLIAGAGENVLVATEDFQSASAGRYSVKVSNDAGSLTSNEVIIGSIPAAPAVLEFRTDTRTVKQGEPVEFAVRAQGTKPIKYQWFKDGVPLEGETSSTLRIAAAQPADRGSYSVTLENSLGNAATSSAILNVWTPGSPSFAQHPPRQINVEEGQIFSLMGEALKPEGISYQWFKDGVPVPGATASELSLQPKIEHRGTYVVRIANEAGWMFSHSTAIWVRPLQLPTFPTPAVTREARVGDPLVIYAYMMNGREGMTFQWLKDGVAIPGATEQNLRFDAVKKSDGGVYSLTVTIPGGSVTSERATLTVFDVPGVYFGDFSDGGRWALQVRPDRTGVFIGYLRDRGSVVIKEIVLDAHGNFIVGIAERIPTQRAQAGLRALSVNSKADGTEIAGYLTFICSVVRNEVTGSVIGTGLRLTGTKEAEPDEQEETYFNGSVRDGYAGEVHVITAPTGKTLVVAAAHDWVDAAFGSLDANGNLIAETLEGGELSLTVRGGSGSVEGRFKQPQGSGAVAFVGLGADAISTTRLTAISTRSRAGINDRTLIMGFAVVGAGEKEVMVRGIGPALGALGVADALADPRLTLYAAGGAPLQQNDDWGGSSEMTQTFARLGMSPALATNSKDAALLSPIATGVYTAHVTSVNENAGIALVEVYDCDADSGARFTALSTRTVAGTGNDTLIAGIVLVGDLPKRLLIRGVGPSLVSQGVSAASTLSDPRLAVFSGSTVVAQNDNWGGAEELKTAFSKVGLGSFASDSSKDAALMVTLNPGVYTVHVSGVNNTSGVALIEVYEVP